MSSATFARSRPTDVEVRIGRLAGVCRSIPDTGRVIGPRRVRSRIFRTLRGIRVAPVPRSRPRTSTHGIDYLQERKAVEIRIMRVDAANSMLAHEDGRVRVVQDVAREPR